MPRLKASESEIETLILDYLKAKKIFAWKNPSAGYFDTRTKRFRKHSSIYALIGVSDIIGVLPDGRALFIEVKSESGRLSPAQKEFLRLAQSQQALCIVAKSLDHVILELSRIVT